MRCYHQRHKGTKGRTFRTGHDHNDKWEYPWNNIPLWLTTCGSCLLVDRLVGRLTTEHNHHRPHFLFLGTQNTHTDTTASSSSSSAMQSSNLNLQFAPLLHAEKSAVAYRQTSEQRPKSSSSSCLCGRHCSTCGFSLTRSQATQQAMNTTTTT